MYNVQDLNMVGDYWGWYNSRSYHHTGMVSTWCVGLTPLRDKGSGFWLGMPGLATCTERTQTSTASDYT